MKIVSWNVAGLRAMVRKGHLEKLVLENDYDVVCLQETKAEEHEVTLSAELTERYPYRFWQSTKGTTQSKGLSGTAIWAKEKPILQYAPPDIDEEGRITALEFNEAIVVSVYTPNSQGLDTARYEFRTQDWHISFLGYIAALKELKPTIICGDLNVANENIDIHKPEAHKKYAGFLDLERSQFKKYLEIGYVDAFRKIYPTAIKKYTYWNQLNPKIRQNNSGWRIDYYLTSLEINIKSCEILMDVYGSDHCPIYLEI